MTARLYISEKEVALDFESESDRDVFFANLAHNPTGGFSPQQAATKIGELTLQLDPSRFPFGYQWQITFRS